MRTIIAAGAVGLAGLLWTGAGAQVHQEPSPGSGVVTIAGTVHVTNTPSVKAAQAGEWTVAVANTPDVRVANTPAVVMSRPGFVTARNTYEVVWPNGDRELVNVEETGRDGWVRVSARRWVNVSGARSVEEKP